MLLKKLLTIILVCGSAAAFAQNVGINSDASTPDASAMLDVKATDKGVLIPRMTMAQRNAITSPATGLLIYQTDNMPGFYFNSGTTTTPSWNIISTGGDVQGTLNGLLVGQGSGNPSTFTPPSTANSQFLSTPTAGGVPTWTTPSDVTGSAVVNVANGNGQGVGSGNISIDVAGAAGGVLHGTGPSSAFTAPGNPGDVLISNGSSAPSWASPNTTLTTSSLTGSPVVSITNGAGQLVGSTNASFDIVGASGGVLYGTGASSAFTNPSTANNQVLATPTAGGAPTWMSANATLATSNIAPATSSAVVVSNGSNQVVGSSPVTVDVQGTAGGVMYGTGANPAAFTPAGTAGQYLKSNGTAAPAFATPVSTYSVRVGGITSLTPGLYGLSGSGVNYGNNTSTNLITANLLAASVHQASVNEKVISCSGAFAANGTPVNTSLVISLYKYVGLASPSCGTALGLVGATGTLIGQCAVTWTSTQYGAKFSITIPSTNVADLAPGDALVLWVQNTGTSTTPYVYSGDIALTTNVQ